MQKKKISIVFVGHVDHGKSTLIGRLLYDTHSISQDKITELEKASLVTNRKLEFAFLLDHLKEEREQGITIDTTQTFFKTEQREYQIIDAPGHVEFIKNMVTGVSQASSAVLIIDAAEGVKTQTKRHAFILSLFGIKQCVVVVNKMDKVGYKQERFDQIVNDAHKLFEQLNLKILHYIPVSALEGDNVCNLSTNMEWYDGGILLDNMDSMEVPEEKENLPYIFAVQDIYKRCDKRIAVGRVEAGTLSVNDIVKDVQKQQITRVASIEKFLEKPKSAKVGECIGITTEEPLFIERGDVLCKEEAKVQVVSSFDASMIWMDQSLVKLNEKLVIRCDTQESSCVIKEIRHKINTAELVETQHKVEQFDYLDAGQVVIETKKEITVSQFSYNESIGRFVILRDGYICGGGVIL